MHKDYEAEERRVQDDHIRRQRDEKAGLHLLLEERRESFREEYAEQADRHQEILTSWRDRVRDLELRVKQLKATLEETVEPTPDARVEDLPA